MLLFHDTRSSSIAFNRERAAEALGSMSRRGYRRITPFSMVERQRVAHVTMYIALPVSFLFEFCFFFPPPLSFFFFFFSQIGLPLRSGTDSLSTHHRRVSEVRDQARLSRPGQPAPIGRLLRVEVGRGGNSTVFFI
ncbi:hypothetical protein LX36DRAFT_453000 [Colletotrichum falcatum]|nr:hypothetical protein LX36DRAFT_453000 [Colletotrichum falcatum]